ncbi:MAG: hypothetical protein M0Z28_31775 [Rhodospirillales bacterium]|nr:hypothetical protein [Rhodospirillales bacterium]
MKTVQDVITLLRRGCQSGDPHHTLYIMPLAEATQMADILDAAETTHSTSDDDVVAARKWAFEVLWRSAPYTTSDESLGSRAIAEHANLLAAWALTGEVWPA